MTVARADWLLAEVLVRPQAPYDIYFTVPITVTVALSSDVPTEFPAPDPPDPVAAAPATDEDVRRRYSLTWSPPTVVDGLPVDWSYDT